MSLSTLRNYNYPPAVAAAGAAILAALPWALPAGHSWALATLQAINTITFAVNVAAVSVPGRIDDMLVQKKKQANKTTSSSSSSSSSGDTADSDISSTSGKRTLVMPADWAFSIWGVIYLGELVWVGSQFVVPAVQALLPMVTVPFAAANLLQSLWCASFRPSYIEGDAWQKFVSVGMLTGTALTLSQVTPAMTKSGNSDAYYYLLPLMIHFGWTSAASLVNLNGSVAMTNVSDRVVIGLGHASVVLAMVLGTGLTWYWHVPAFGATLSWALAATADGLRQQQNDVSTAIFRGMELQKLLCWLGSGACAAAAAAAVLYSSSSSSANFM